METRMVYLCLLSGLLLPTWAAVPFDYAQLCTRAEELSRASFQPAAPRVPQGLANLDYEQYQSIHFRRDHALWRSEGLPFEIEFFLPGFIHKQTVTVHEVSRTGLRKIPFSAEAFTYGTNRLDLSSGVDYAGFRIVGVSRQPEEIGSFLDASYFRMTGLGQAFGTSARGLALNTVLLGQEEFPSFQEFWLRKPERSDQTLTLWALLDSPSVAGAFEFVIAPGLTTVTRTKATFYARREVHEFGIAPLTSMFLHDLNSHPPQVDFRPAVHDADGLLLHNGQDQWIWRPLERGKMMRVNAYLDADPKGFGFLQRDRDFSHYEDLNARFEGRPNVWVVPQGSWGKGHVELIQLPSNLEYTDNVVAFWIPGNPPKAGDSLTLAYETHWGTNQVGSPVLGWVRSTLIGQTLPPKPGGKPNLRFVIDFAGSAIETLTARDQPKPEIHCGDGATFLCESMQKNEIDGSWRLAIEITPPTKAVDLDARLVQRGRPITETWVYTWQP